MTVLEERNNRLEVEVNLWQTRLYDERKEHIALLQRYVEMTGDKSILTTVNAEIENDIGDQ